MGITLGKVGLGWRMGCGRGGGGWLLEGIEQCEGGVVGDLSRRWQGGNTGGSVKEWWLRKFTVFGEV